MNPSKVSRAVRQPCTSPIASKRGMQTFLTPPLRFGEGVGGRGLAGESPRDLSPPAPLSEAERGEKVRREPHRVSQVMTSSAFALSGWRLRLFPAPAGSLAGLPLCR